MCMREVCGLQCREEFFFVKLKLDSKLKRVRTEFPRQRKLSKGSATSRRPKHFNNSESRLLTIC